MILNYNKKNEENLVRLSCQEPKSDLSNLRDCGFLCTGKLHILNTAGERPVWNLKPHCTEINCFLYSYSRRAVGTHEKRWKAERTKEQMRFSDNG